MDSDERVDSDVEETEHVTESGGDVEADEEMPREDQDDVASGEEEEEVEQAAEHEEHEAAADQDDEEGGDAKAAGGATETARALEARRRELDEKQAEFIAEYEEIRRKEREEEEEELKQMRERIEQRKKEREVEEEKMREARRLEEEKWKQIEEERRIKKEEEEKRKKAEKLAKLKELEEKRKAMGKRNFKVEKKKKEEAAEGVASVVGGGRDMQKSREQLEEEKRAVLAQRIKPLEIDGLDDEGLLEMAKQLYSHWEALESEKYDMEQRFKRQQYDLMELAERSRQMNKGGKKGPGGVERQDDFDREHDRFSQAPAPVKLCSTHEMKRDLRGMNEKIDAFSKPPVLEGLDALDELEGYEDEE